MGTAAGETLGAADMAGLVVAITGETAVPGTGVPEGSIPGAGVEEVGRGGTIGLEFAAAKEDFPGASLEAELGVAGVVPPPGTSV